MLVNYMAQAGAHLQPARGLPAADRARHPSHHFCETLKEEGDIDFCSYHGAPLVFDCLRSVPGSMIVPK